MRRPLLLALLAIALTPASASAIGPPSDSCSRILVTDEYGRDITPCGAPRRMTGTQIVELVRAALAERFG
jgi:hypothetical protein